jgi:hypothetical protein
LFIGSYILFIGSYILFIGSEVGLFVPRRSRFRSEHADTRVCGVRGPSPLRAPTLWLGVGQAYTKDDKMIEEELFHNLSQVQR